MSQTDMDIALTSKRINMALDDFIKEGKKDNKKQFNRNNRGGNNRNRASNYRNNNNNNNNNNNGFRNNRNNNNNNRNNNNSGFKRNNNNKDVSMRNFSSPKVKKTLDLSSPNKRMGGKRTSLVNPEKIKIQIQNKTIRKPTTGLGLTSRPKRIGGAPRINLTRNTRPSGITRNPRPTTTTATKRPTRIVQRYEKPVTLNDRFSKK